MTPLPIGKNQHARTLLANNANHLQAILPSVFNASVGNVESRAPRNFQNARGLGGLAGAVLHGAARSHFSLRQVENAGAISALRHFEESSGAGLFHVVTVLC